MKHYYSRQQIEANTLPPKKNPPKYCLVQSHQLIVILVLFMLLRINEYSIPRIVFFSNRLYQSTLNQANRGYNTLRWHKIVRCAKAGHANCPLVKTTIRTQRELRTQQICTKKVCVYFPIMEAIYSHSKGEFYWILTNIQFYWTFYSWIEASH